MKQVTLGVRPVAPRKTIAYVISLIWNPHHIGLQAFFQVKSASGPSTPTSSKPNQVSKESEPRVAKESETRAKMSQTSSELSESALVVSSDDDDEMPSRAGGRKSNKRKSVVVDESPGSSNDFAPEDSACPFYTRTHKMCWVLISVWFERLYYQRALALRFPKSPATLADQPHRLPLNPKIILPQTFPAVPAHWTTMIVGSLVVWISTCATHVHYQPRPLQVMLS